MGANDIRTLLEALLAKSEGYETRVSYEHKRGLATRFADNAITQPLGGEEETIRLSLTRDGKQGSAVTNRLSEESLARLVDRATSICAAAAPDTEYMPPLAQPTYPDVPKRDYEDVSALTPAHLAQSVGRICSLSSEHGYNASGLIEATRKRKILVNSAGLRAEDAHTQLSLATTIHGPRGSGRSDAISESAAGIDADAVGKRALGNAIAAQDPAPIEPGEYTVIMEPAAVWDFVGWLTANMDAREAAEGVSALSDCLGKRIFDERVNISLELDDRAAPAAPFAGEGLPLRQTRWIEDGVLRRLSHGRYWAAEQGMEPDADLFPFCMAGEDKSLADLIAGCERGLLIKRLWYIRYLDRREMMLTGMTRDGLFLVENGTVSQPVMNLRFNESPLVFLNNIVAMSRPERVNAWGIAKVPAIMSREFTFGSKSDSL